jgi:hypothetical protein
MLHVFRVVHISLTNVSLSVGFVIHNNVIEKMENLSPPAYPKCNDYHADADEESGSTSQAANIRAISISAAR